MLDLMEKKGSFLGFHALNYNEKSVRRQTCLKESAGLTFTCC